MATRTRSRSRSRLKTLSASAWSPFAALPGTVKARDQIATMIDSKNKQWAVWRDSSSGNFDLWYSKRRLKREWQPAAMLNGTRGIDEFAFANAPDDTKLVVWYDASPVKRVGYLEIKAAPGEPSFLPNTTRLNDQYPHITAAPDGTRHLVWAGGTRIFHATSSDGKNWDIGAVTRSEGFTRPIAAIDPLTQTLHLFYLSAGGDGTIFYQQRPLDSATWSRAKTLGTGKELHLAARNGKLMLSWGNDTSAERQVAVRFLENEQWSTTMRPPGVSVSGFQPHGAIDSRGDAHLIWSQFVGKSGNRETYTLHYSDFVGGVWSDAQSFEMSPANNVGSDLAISADDKLYAVYVRTSALDSPYSTDRALPAPL